MITLFYGFSCYLFGTRRFICMVSRDIHFSLEYNTKENLDYVYQRIIHLMDEGHSSAAHSVASEFEERIDERWLQ